MLAAAHLFERVWRLYPCPLCLQQRDAYWTALALSVVAIIADKTLGHSAINKVTAILIGLAFFAGAGVAIYHSGVELGLIASSCGSVDFEPTGNLLDELSKPMIVGQCDEPAWKMLGVTMANINALASLALSGLSFYVATRGKTASAKIA